MPRPLPCILDLTAAFPRCTPPACAKAQRSDIADRLTPPGRFLPERIPKAPPLSESQCSATPIDIYTGFPYD